MHIMTKPRTHGGRTYSSHRGVLLPACQFWFEFYSLTSCPGQLSNTRDVLGI